MVSQCRRVNASLHPHSLVVLWNLRFAVDNVADMAPVLQVPASVDGQTREVVECRRDAVEKAVDRDTTRIRSISRDHGVSVVREGVVGTVIFRRESDHC